MFTVTMNIAIDPSMDTVLWWLGLSVAISMGILFAIPYPLGIVAIATTFILVGYIIPMKIMSHDKTRISASKDIVDCQKCLGPAN